MSQTPATTRRRGWTFIEFCIWFVAWQLGWFSGKVLHTYLPIGYFAGVWRFVAAFGGCLVLCGVAIVILRIPKLGLSGEALRRAELTASACIAGLCVGLLEL